MTRPRQIAAPSLPAAPVTIRPGRAEDLDALLALEHAVFAGDRASRRALRHALRSPSMSVLAALAPDEDGPRGRREVLVGAATIERRANSRIARLSSIAVSRRGVGLGSLLIEAVEADALAHGRTRLRLEVRADNGTAIRLYERRGYRRYAVRPDYYEDGTTAWCFEKPVGRP